VNPPVSRQIDLDETKLPTEVFERLSHRGAMLKDRRRRREEAMENFGKPGRDPSEFSNVMSSIAGNDVWSTNLKLAQLRNHWDQVVGEGIANHSAVADFTDGVLTIRAQSAVWATQLTYLIPQLSDTIRRNLKGLTINEIRVTGPAAGYTRKWARKK
jgi:predicted nucleic acid-binding Zn ribbon protein